jgi:RNA polymerase sigma-70 factor (ECF subfamily)
MEQRTNETPFEELYRRTAPAVRGYLTARGVDDPEAVTQDVFLALLPRLATAHGGEAGISTLLFSIAHARSVDHHRRRTRNPVTVEYAADDDPRIAPSAEDRVLGSAKNSSVVAMLGALPVQQREVLLLRIVADLPIDSVATIMNTTAGAVKQLQRRALLTLKGDLAPDPHRTAAAAEGNVA